MKKTLVEKIVVACVAVLGLILAIWGVVAIVQKIGDMQENAPIAAGELENNKKGEQIQSDSSGVQPDIEAQTRLREVLEEITQYETGTAGSSLKAATISAKLLDFTEDAPLSQDAAYQTAQEYLQNLDDAQALRFEQNLSIIADYATEIANGEQSALEELESAGNPQQHDSYTVEKLEFYLDIIQDAM